MLRVARTAAADLEDPLRQQLPPAPAHAAPAHAAPAHAAAGTTAATVWPDGSSSSSGGGGGGGGSAPPSLALRLLLEGGPLLPSNEASALRRLRSFFVPELQKVRAPPIPCALPAEPAPSRARPVLPSPALHFVVKYHTSYIIHAMPISGEHRFLSVWWDLTIVITDQRPPCVC